MTSYLVIFIENSISGSDSNAHRVPEETFEHFKNDWLAAQQKTKWILLLKLINFFNASKH